MKWNKKEIKSDLIKSFATEFSISMPMATVLIRRDILSKEQLKFFLESNLYYMHQPFLFQDMEKAVNRIIKAKEEGEKVLVYGDKDVDGITGTTIIVKALRYLGIDVEWAVPVGEQTYSISEEFIQDFYDTHISLVITIDCGISNHDAVAFANSLGIDVLIFDHHTPCKTLPDAYAVINAKIPEQGYPFTDICAGVLASKLYTALLISQNEIYQQDICLMNAVPLNSVLNIEIICVRNLVPKWQRTISVSKDLYSSREELQHVIADMPIFVFNASMQKKLIHKYLGDTIDIFLNDMLPDWQQNYPHLPYTSLLEVQESIKIVRYHERPIKEIDLLYQIYTMIMTKKIPCVQETMDAVSDLAAIATVADIMPLHDENRIIVQKGLEKLHSKPSLGIQALLTALRLQDKKISSQTIGWRIAPVINASGRMGQADIAVRLFLEEDIGKANELAQQLKQFNKQRITQMDDIREIVHEQAELSLEKYKDYVIIHDENIPHSFTGSIANNILRQYSVPAIVITTVDEHTMNASIRCDAFINANHLIENIRYLLIDGGGHSAAAGFSFEAKHYDTLIGKIEENMSKFLSEGVQEDNQDGIDIDLELPEQYFDIQQIKDIVNVLAPYGKEWGMLTLLLRNVSLASIDLVGNASQHVKMVLKVAKYHVPAMLWNHEDSSISIESLKAAKKISLVSNIKIDEYDGKEQFALIVKEMECH